MMHISTPRRTNVAPATCRRLDQRRAFIAADREGLVKRRKRSRGAPPYGDPFADADAPNDCWAIDFKGWARTGDGARVDPLTLIDADSRFLIACEGLPRPTLAYVLPVVERAFQERGLPNAIRSDNGPPFASAGLGGLSAFAGVVDRLRELGAPVYGVQFGGRAPHPVQFGNLRSEIFWELRRLLEERLIALPNDDALAGQLLTLRYDVSSSSQVRLESKKAMRTKGLPSPDLADALAMAFMRPPSLQIWTGNEPFLRAARNGAAPNDVGVPVPRERNGAADDGHAPDGNGAGYGADGNGAAHDDRHSREGGNPAPNGADGNAAYDAADAPAPVGAGSSSPYKGRGGREAAGEGTGDAPPPDAPAPPDHADVPSTGSSSGSRRRDAKDTRFPPTRE